MPCCKCVEYTWVHSMPVEMVGDDGREFCILHAPNGHHLKKIDKFRNAIAEKVSNSDEEETCQLSGIIFPEDFSLHSSGIADKTQTTDLSYAVFNGIVDGRFCTFRGPIIFDKAEFKKDVLFKRAIFNNEVSFRNTKILNIRLDECNFGSRVHLENTACSGRFESTNCRFEHLLISKKSIFEGDQTFDRTEFEYKVNFDEVRCLGNVVFVGCKLIQGGTFTGCTFEGDFLCRATDFNNSTGFNHCIFFKQTTFQACLFSNATSFINSLFKDTFSAKWSKVDGTINYFKTTFSGLADFSGATFKKRAAFVESVFYKKVYFGTAKVQAWSDIFFRRSSDSTTPANFENEVDFSYAEFRDELYFDKTSFNGPAIFNCTRFFSKTIFSNANINDSIIFHNSIISDTMSLLNDEIINLPSKGELSFKNSIITNQVKITQARLNKFNMYDVDLSKFYFYCCEWEKDNNGVSHIHAGFQPTHDNLEKLENIYRSLKKAALDNRDEIMASDWHYQEKLACRKKLKQTKNKEKCKKFLYRSLCLYELCSGYGERPDKALKCLICILATTFLILLYSKLPEIKNTQWQTFIDTIYDVTPVLFKMSTFMPISGENENFSYYMALFISRVLFPIQIALFTFSLRNKLRR